MNLRKIITITASATIIATSFSTISNIESNLIVIADRKNEISNEQFDSDVNAAVMAVSIAKNNGFTIGDIDSLKSDDGNRIYAYTGKDNEDTFAGLLSGITDNYNDDSNNNYTENITENYDENGNRLPDTNNGINDVGIEYKNTYSAIKYLYKYFYNRFDAQTKAMLTSYYNDSSEVNYCALAMNLAEAIQNWGEQFDSVAFSPREVIENNNKIQAEQEKQQAEQAQRETKRINYHKKIAKSKKYINLVKKKYKIAKNNLQKHHSKKNKKAITKAKHNLEIAQAKYNALIK